MAISFVGSSNVANGLAQGTSATVPRPAGVLDGDHLLAFISIGHTGAITAPAGWSEVPLGVNTVGATLQNRIYTKVASSEPATWTWTFTSAAYVGIAHATRGVGGIFAAQQSDDGLSLLAHTTPTLAAPADAWLVSSWTGRNLLALGWSAPVGDVERQDVIGGLLVLLNVNHAVDDTNGPVAAGSYSKTAATLLAVRALDALVVLAPTLDPVQVQTVKAPASFGTFSIEHTLTLPDVLKSPITFGPFIAELNVTAQAILAPVAFGVQVLERDILADPEIRSSVTFEDMSASFELVFDIFLRMPLEFGPLESFLSLEIESLGIPVTITSDAVALPEQTIMIVDRLPIPIIAGSGGILQVLMTFAQGPEFINVGTLFGKQIVFVEYPYGGNCC